MYVRLSVYLPLPVWVSELGYRLPGGKTSLDDDVTAHFRDAPRSEQDTDNDFDSHSASVAENVAYLSQDT